MELNTILNLLISYNLTASELLLVYLTFLARDEENHPEYFVKWFNNGGQSQLKDLFNSLKDKGIIHKNYNPKVYNPNDIEFNKTFLKSWIKNSGELGQELFDNYPKFLHVNGKMVPLTNISKRYSSLEELFFSYSAAIGHNPEKHKEVMELLEWAKDNDHIRYSIVEFIASRKWTEIQAIKDNNLDNITANSDSIYIDD